MNGEIEFNQALTERVALLEGLSHESLEEVYQKIVFTEGAKELITVAKHLGYKTAVLSGGFTYFTNKIKDVLKLDYAYANTLEIIDGKVTGKVTGDIVNAKRNQNYLKK